MKALVLHGDFDLRYEEFEEPTTGPGQVKIKVGACGICGSDIPRITQGKAHYYPIVLGHELSGEITEVGDGVTSLAVGDHAAVVPLVPCENCPDCDAGFYSQCKHYTFIGSRIQGGLADYLVVPEKNAVKLDPTTPYALGALCEPASVALHGLRTAGYEGGGHVAILGGGTIGIFAMQWAKVLGAERVTVFGRDAKHLALATRLGADAVIRTQEPEEMQAAIDSTEGRGFDAVFECAGVSATMKLAFELVKNHGTVCMIGTPVGDISFTQSEWELLNRKEILLTGSWMSGSAPFPGDEWRMTADAFARGDLRFDEELFFRRLPMSDSETLLALLADRDKIKGRILMENQI